MQKTIQITVRGKVQGVFFRQYAKEKATELGLSGTIQNIAEGRVLIIATGTTSQLALFTEWCKTGPPRSIVNGLERQEIPLQSFTDFSVIRS
ncbi:MAG: acylphosphatase [Chitinophagaceae bacterium]|nr:acylphosphatase [Chitinophagaceae bacterium]